LLIAASTTKAYNYAQRQARKSSNVTAIKTNNEGPRERSKQLNESQSALVMPLIKECCFACLELAVSAARIGAALITM